MGKEPGEAPYVVVWDLETQRTFEEVGGRKPWELGLAVAVAWRSDRNTFEAFRATESRDLIKLLRGAVLLVGYNTIDFDVRVMEPHGLNKRLWGELRHLDLFDKIRSATDAWPKLDDVARCTLGRGKSGRGLESVSWFRAGQIDRVIEYCARDVELTRDLYWTALQGATLHFTGKSGKQRKVRIRAEEIEGVTVPPPRPSGVLDWIVGAPPPVVERVWERSEERVAQRKRSAASAATPPDPRAKQPQASASAVQAQTPPAPPPLTPATTADTGPLPPKTPPALVDRVIIAARRAAAALIAVPAGLWLIGIAEVVRRDPSVPAILASAILAAPAVLALWAAWKAWPRGG